MISVTQASLKLKATTRDLVWSALMPLVYSYQVDHMFQMNMICGIIPTDIIDARYKSLHAEKYYQMFWNKGFFAEVYPVNNKFDYHIGLDEFWDSMVSLI